MHKLMAVFAHPDDETFICGGTLAKHAAEGSVVVVCATLGEMGRRMGSPPTETRESIPQIRARELQAACQALHIDQIHLLGLRDKTLEIQPPDFLQDLVWQRLVHERPSDVITFHPRWGGHPDHCAMGAATLAAFRRYQTTVPTSNLMFVCSGDMIRHPDGYGLQKEQLSEIDVTPYVQQKLYAFRAHQSQSQMMDWLWDDDESSVSHLWSLEYLLDWRTLQDV